jgi:hypothetical protein
MRTVSASKDRKPHAGRAWDVNMERWEGFRMVGDATWFGIGGDTRQKIHRLDVSSSLFSREKGDIWDIFGNP